MATNGAVIRDLQRKIRETIHPVIPLDGRLALVDFPNYSNVGDSAIWLGTIRYLFSLYKIRPTYVSTLDAFSGDELNRVLSTGPIFLQGGGNFGDLWPHHQDFREMILRQYRDRPVVQLPQSIHFQSEERLKRAADIINAHPNFTLFVRDEPSYELAVQWFTCKVRLCPDMAFYLGRQPRPIARRAALLCLLRTDSESAVATVPAQGCVQDWLDEPADTAAKVRKKSIAYLPLIGFSAIMAGGRRELYYRRLAGARVRRGIKQLSGFRYVISDRLHVHILCTLLGIPHTVLDNSYGKVGRFHKAWTTDLESVRASESLAAAVTGWEAGMQVSQ